MTKTLGSPAVTPRRMALAVRTARASRAAVLLALLGSANPAGADVSPYTHHAADGLITGVAWIAGSLFVLFPVDGASTWSVEPFGFDRSVQQNFSSAAATTSDALLFAASVSPVLAMLADHPDAATGQAVLVYAESLAITHVITAATKHLVQRPRPYTHNRDPRVQIYARERSAASRLSFFSGHASMAFTAAVGGSHLFALKSASTAARATLWGVELALAAAAANLRVRAGQHYYSDVIVGALVGSAVGALVPLAHARDPGQYSPRPAEWIAMAAGLSLGLLVSQLLPFGPADARAHTTSAVARWIQRISPFAGPGGTAGLALHGTIF